jgi:hypothetical protein
MTIKIIKRPSSRKKYKGSCIHCCITVSCDLSDTKMDTDQREGVARYIMCPNPKCRRNYLWVK